MPHPSAHRIRDVIETLLIAGAGGFLFDLLRFPAGWLAGAMVFCAAASLAGRPLAIPNKLARAVFILLGMSMGAGPNPPTGGGKATLPARNLAAAVAIGAGA